MPSEKSRTLRCEHCDDGQFMLGSNQFGEEAWICRDCKRYSSGSLTILTLMMRAIDRNRLSVTFDARGCTVGEQCGPMDQSCDYKPVTRDGLIEALAVWLERYEWNCKGARS